MAHASSHMEHHRGVEYHTLPPGIHAETPGHRQRLAYEQDAKSIQDAPTTKQERTTINKTPRAVNGGSDYAETKERSKTQCCNLFTFLEDSWVLELLALLCSGLTLAAIAAILMHYDKRQQPDWTLISLNTLISWLSTFAKACVLLPVATSIGQLKWVWFASASRPASQLRTFDAASRGVLGSGQLLWIQKFLHLASIGCIATVLAVGFEPFIQNLVHYHPEAVVDGTTTAKLANTFNYSAVLNQGGSQFDNLDPIMKANVYNALLNTDESQPWAIPKFRCATGNCSWTDVPAFYVRPSCVNLQHQVSTTCFYNHTHGCSTSIPGGLSLTYPVPWQQSDPADNIAAAGTYIGMRVYSPEVETVSFGTGGSINWSIRPVKYILAPGSVERFTAGPGYIPDYPIRPNGTFMAASCKLDLCVQLLDISVKDSIYTEHSKKVNCSGSYRGLNAESMSTYVLPDPRWAEGNVADNAKGFTINGQAYLAIANFLWSLFNGHVLLDIASNTAIAILGNGDYSYATADILQPLWYGNLSRCGLEDDRLTCAMNNTAKAITKSLRDSAYIALGDVDTGANGTSNGIVANGDTMVILTFVRIDWYWLILPILVWLLSVVTWLGTIWKTRRGAVPSWANNPLPQLFIYRDPMHSGPEDPVTNKGCGKWADQLLVQLHVKGKQAYLA